MIFHQDLPFCWKTIEIASAQMVGLPLYPESSSCLKPYGKLLEVSAKGARVSRASQYQKLHPAGARTETYLVVQHPSSPQVSVSGCHTFAEAH